MMLDLSQLERGRLEAAFQIPPESPVLEGFGGEVTEPIDLGVSVRHPSGDTFVIDAVMTGSLTRSCRRCLAPVELELDDRFRIVVQISEEGDGSGDVDVILTEPGALRVDLTEPVRDRLFLETDLYPLCRPECAGFCTRCGRNLDEGPCHCEPEPAESRWRALEAIRQLVREGT
jgi:uncharacterized protein